RLDLGPRVVGPLVGVGRADARVVPDRLPALRVLPAAAVLDRGPGEAVHVRERVRDRRGRVRAAELPRRAAVPEPRAPAGPVEHEEPSGPDGPHLPGGPPRDGAPVRDALEVRDGFEEHDLAAAAAAQAAPRRRGHRARPLRRAARDVSLPLAAAALPLHEAGKYVAGAYIVFVALI